MNTPELGSEGREGSIGPIRSRVTRACDNCKSRRAKCQLAASGSGFATQCVSCQEQGVECTFSAPVRRRGPQPGFKKTQDLSRNNSRSFNRDHDLTPSASPAPRVGSSKLRVNEPLFGLPPDLVDELLAVYFTHVHNVWPLIYKPLFNPHTTSQLLLLSILAIASCLSKPNPADVPASHSPYDPEALFHMAELSLRECDDRDECRIDTIQALVLMSLRQTGNGHKQSAFMYSGRACIGALSIGLNLKPSRPVSVVDTEIRSRVYWNVYLLDKTLSEETGRPCLLHYRQSSTPYPSINETDELETWPPLPMSSAPLPQSVRHVIPRRGYIMSCFAWACRLAVIFERILSLEMQTHVPVDGWDFQFQKDRFENKEQDLEDLSGQLDAWRRSIPSHIEVDINSSISPLPHHVVTLAWYHTAQLLLFSRFTRKKYPNASPFSPSGSLIDQSHAICSQAAQDTIDLFACVDSHKLLTSVSSDVIHMLSITTLFEAFDSTNADESIAHRAKVNFAQCCIWLRDFSASWPTASAHKLFFEGLIQGGLRLTSLEEEGRDLDDTGTPSHGLRTFGRDLSVIDRTNSGTPPQIRVTHSNGSANGDAGAQFGDIFQLPQIYWNQLTNNDTPAQASYPGMEIGPTSKSPNSPPWMGVEGMLHEHENPWAGLEFEQSSQTNAHDDDGHGGSVHAHHGYLPTHVDAGRMAEGTDLGLDPDQSAIYTALMSYMVQAARAT